MPAKGAQSSTIEAAGPQPEALPTLPLAPALELAGVEKRFRAGGGPIEALRALDLSVAAGERVGVVGPSGCGKSTLLELIAGLEEPQLGSVRVLGSDRPADRLRGCALMPQRDALLPWRSALDNAALALELAGQGRRAARAQARELFKRFGLAGFERARPQELSGGMRQRVAFARTVLAGKPVLLLDEPFAALDSITRAQMQEWLAGALDERSTVVLVSHDIEEALYLCDRVVVMSARPGTVRAELDSALAPAPNRAAAVTSPDFIALRHAALVALG